MKTNATVTHYRISKTERKAIKKARKNRNQQRQIKRGIV